MDLDEVAEELYAVPPGQFVAARTEAARRARAAGDRALAREIGALGRPSTAAWACNVLVREQPDEIAGLVELGDLLREAQQTLAGDELRQLGTQRSRLLAALTRRARVVAAGRGTPLSDAVADQVEETLRAALADPDAGEALLGGRLTAPLSSRGLGPGFGTRPDLRVVPPRTGRTPPAAARPPEDAARRAAEERRRAAQERRDRELAAAREEAEAAERDAAEAEAAAWAAHERAGRATRRQEELAARARELEAELERVRADAEAAGAEAARTGRRAAAADRAARRAAADRDRAAARVTELEQAPLEA
ncbi:hypothetical protein ACI8AA_16235 [Geodermatophilus sp. SYSU D01180]